ncbi:NAD P-binding protein [Dipodascopsis tothii]|uniref:NAD P-binding protein n=1 Tax=Dipodascopsis tothii TaxID=44089 RepID=UPI0034CE3C93
MSFNSVPLFNLDGQIAVVTGGGSGLGLAMAQGLEQNGATVYILGRRLELLEKAAAGASSGRIIPIQADVTVRGDLERAADVIKERSGKVNLLVLNSGKTDGVRMPQIERGGDVAKFREQLLQQTPESWADLYNLNVSSVFFSAAVFIELLDAANKKRTADEPTSQIIITGSVAGYIRQKAYSFSYFVSKAAVHHLAKTLATYFLDIDVRVNFLAPAIFPSEITQDFVTETGELPRDIIPMGRAGKLSEIAGTVVYLASKVSGFTTGLGLLIDGGSASLGASTY